MMQYYRLAQSQIYSQRLLMSAGWLLLNDVLVKDVRGLIWRRLNALDRAMIRAAHGVSFANVAALYRLCGQHNERARIMWLETAGRLSPEFGQLAFEAALEHGSLAVAKYLAPRTAPSPDRTWSMAILGGSLAVVKWLYSDANACNFSDSAYSTTCTLMATAGHVHLLQWARSCNPPIPWSAQTCQMAARYGRLHVLQWLRAQTPPAPWGVKVCIEAILYDRLELLQWARAQEPPVPWDRRVRMIAVMKQFPSSAADWALQNGLEFID